MKVPLKIETSFKEDELYIYHNDKILVEKIPFKRFILSNVKSDGRKKVMKDLFSKETINIYQHIIEKKKDYWTTLKGLKSKGKVFTQNYLEQLFTFTPDYCNKFPHSKDIRYHCMDIEVATKGDNVFPKANDTPIVCIGYSDSNIDNNKTVVDYWDKDYSDYNLINNYLDKLIKEKPHVIVTYNGDYFDLSYIFKRCLVLDETSFDGVELNKVKVKKGGLAYKFKLLFKIPTKFQDYYNYKFGTHFDIYKEVVKDQLLCYDKQTEVLTQNGWKLFKDLNNKDKIATLNIEKDLLEYQLPTKLQSYKNTKKMYYIKSKSVDLMVTYNHDLLAEYPINKYNKNNRKWDFIKPNKLEGNLFKIKRNVKNWIGKNIDYFYLPEIERNKMEFNYNKQYKFNMKDWLIFLGYYISEGSHYYNKKNGIYSIKITQDKKIHPNNVRKIMTAITNMGFKCKYYESNISIEFKSKRLFLYLNKFGKAKDKFIPSEFLNLNKYYLKILFESLMDGDGTYSHLNKNGYMTTPIYSTISKQLADNIQELVLKLGYASSNIIETRTKPIDQDIYRITIQSKHTESIINQGRKKDGWIEYNDMVYCCTVPNNTLFIRRNGFTCWSGNSGIKNKRMKTVADWYNIEDIVTGEDIVNNVIKAYENGDLPPYIESDIHLTKELYKIYFPKVQSIAETLGVPLHNVIVSPNSFVPKLFSMRNLLSRNFIALEKNTVRYPFMNENKYEGAICGINNSCPNCGKKIFIRKDKEVTCGNCGREELNDLNTTNPGFIKKIWKYDFASQYPSSMITWNLSPDSIMIYEINLFKDGFKPEYKFWIDDDFKWMQVPDLNFKGNFIIRINKEDGFIKTELLNLFKQRKELKLKMKEAYKNKDFVLGDSYNSQQNSKKVLLNSSYGIQGLGFSEWGDLAVALTVTAMCRWTMQHVMDWLGDCCIETDSVTGNTPVYVKDKKGMIDIIPIEDLHNGNDKRIQYNGNYEILTRNGFKPIKYTKKHNVNKPIHRVKVSDGYVDVTCDHSLFDKNKEEISPKNIIPNETFIEVKDGFEKVLDNIILHSNENIDVYDVSTEDGTFVTALGDIVLHNTDGEMVDGTYFNEKYRKSIEKRIIKDVAGYKPNDVEKDDNIAYEICNMLNYGLNTLIEPLFGVKNYMILEPEEFDQGYLYRAKNYCLMEEGKIIKHGVGLKSSRKPKIVDIAMDKVIKAVLEEDTNILHLIEDLKNLDNYKIEDFAMSTNIKQPLSKYKSQTCLAVTVGKQAEEVIKREVDKGDTIYYVKTIKPKFSIIQNTERKNIDKEYYLNEIMKILKIFKLDKTKTTTLWDY